MKRIFKLLSGERRGPASFAIRSALWATQWPYAAAVAIRNRHFDQGRDVTAVDVPVISVGNLTTGGTGKTPLVAWLARAIREADVRVAILSRGYGASEGAINDEALELERRLPDVPHLQAPDRVAMAAVAVEELASQLLLLDDGFQHRRLARDLDIVVLDATNPFGFGNLLPRGLLREPIASLRRADVIVLSRADAVDAETRQTIRDRALSHAPQAVWAEATHAPLGLTVWDDANPSPPLQPSESWAGRRLGMICGIGNPGAFEHTLATMNLAPVAAREYPDHHRYSREDLADLASWAEADHLDGLVTTVKDLVKLQTPRIGHCPLAAVEIAWQWTVGEASVRDRIAPLLERAAEI